MTALGAPLDAEEDGRSKAAPTQPAPLPNIEEDIGFRFFQRAEETLRIEAVGPDRQDPSAHAEATARYRFLDFARRSASSSSVV